MKQTILSILLLAALTVSGQEPRIKLTENQAHAIIGAGSFAKSYTLVNIFYKTNTDLDRELKALGAAYGFTIFDGIAVEAYKMMKDVNRPFDWDAFGGHVAGGFKAAAITLFFKITWHWIIKPLFNGSLKFTAPDKYKW